VKPAADFQMSPRKRRIVGMLTVEDIEHASLLWQPTRR
jgi:hypothetical protein